jgi:hypothetical protein
MMIMTVMIILKIIFKNYNGRNDMDKKNKTKIKYVDMF